MIRQTLLMCAPDYYGVDYVINAWMEGQVGQTHHRNAITQWENLRRELSREADIALLPPEPGVPDLVFTANAGMVLGKQVIVSRFREPERRLEEPFNRAWFVNNGFEPALWPEDIAFEGAGDALFDRGQPLVWFGHGFRSDAAAGPEIGKIFGRRVVPLKLIDPRFYHLDTCLCPLPRGWLLYYPPAFDDAARAAIEALVPKDKRIVASDDDALRFNCNAVDLNDRVFMNDPTPSLIEALKKAGFASATVPLGEFLKGGGTAKCLTLKLLES
jgi:N-dimethylarginine dimethylaminohydrolase